MTDRSSSTTRLDLHLRAQLHLLALTAAPHPSPIALRPLVVTPPAAWHAHHGFVMEELERAHSSREETPDPPSADDSSPAPLQPASSPSPSPPPEPISPPPADTLHAGSASASPLSFVDSLPLPAVPVLLPLPSLPLLASLDVAPALPLLPLTDDSLPARTAPPPSSDGSDDDSEVELLPSPFTGQKRRRGAGEGAGTRGAVDPLQSRELIVVSSDDSDDSEEGGEEEDEAASLRALVRFGRRLPLLRSSPLPAYATSAVDDGYLAQLAKRRTEKKQRKWLKKQARLAASDKGRGQQRRSRSEERGGRWSARVEQQASSVHGGSRVAVGGLHKRRRISTPRPSHRHLLVCEDGRVFPISLLDPSVDGIAHVIMLDLDNWPSQQRQRQRLALSPSPALRSHLRLCLCAVVCEGFFLRLPNALDDHVLVCGFVGGHSSVKVPNDSMSILTHSTHTPHLVPLPSPTPSSSSSSPAAASSFSSSPPPFSSPFARLVWLRHVMLTSSGETSNASDFAMSVKCGQLHATLPLHIPFTIFSGDKGLDEVCRHLPGRRCQRVDPHAQHVAGQMEHTQQLMWATLQSITDR